MTAWDGRGLPPAAQARVSRAAQTGVATSLLSAPSTASLAHVGLEPVGEVMGVVVLTIGWGGYGCPIYVGGMGYQPSYTPPQVSGQGFSGYSAWVQALYNGYEGSLHRLLLEAQALGADGVVDIRWTQQRLDDGGAREFLAMGTAVRARSATRPSHLFSTNLSGADVAKLLLAGWVPTGLAIGISVGLKHDDYATRLQRSLVSANQEVVGYTDLVQAVRHDARAQFTARARRQGGDSAIVARMSVDMWETERGEHRDHLAQAVLSGTAIAKFGRSTEHPAASLAVMPLTAFPSRRAK